MTQCKSPLAQPEGVHVWNSYGICFLCKEGASKAPEPKPAPVPPPVEATAAPAEPAAPKPDK